MKVIEIKKHGAIGFRLGHVILDDINDPEEIGEHVEDWCYSDASGHGNGWRSEWKEITDEEARAKIIHDEVLKIDRNISLLAKRRDSLLDEISPNFIALK
jgi:hypothetical protein